MPSDPLVNAVDEDDFRITLTWLTILAWLTGPFAETEADRVKEEDGERLRRPFFNMDLYSANPLGARRSSAGAGSARRHRWKYLRGYWALIRWWWQLGSSGQSTRS